MKLHTKILELQQTVLNIIKYYDTLKSEAMDNTEFNTLQNREAIEISDLSQKTNIKDSK